MRAKSAISALGLSLVLAACNGGGLAATSTSGASTLVSSTPTSTLPPVVECPGAGEFGEGSGIAEIDGEGSDSTTLSRVMWQSSDQCETFEFDFETSEGAPATTVPDITVSHLETFQVLRVRMGVNTVVVTDQLVETELVDRIYAVRGLDGDLFVDLHLRAPAAARARVDSSPARLTIDLRPGLVQHEGMSKIGDRVVVVSPGDSSSVNANAPLIGYVRDFDGDVTILISRSGAVVSETSVPAAASDVIWGEFRAEVVLPPGEISVFFGQPNPADGTLDGVNLDLSVS